MKKKILIISSIDNLIKGARTGNSKYEFDVWFKENESLI